jgi:plastocyanin
MSVPRTLLALASCVALLTACDGAPSREGGRQPRPAETFDVFLDARTEAPGLALAAYFPATITVHPGDRLTFYNQSYTDEHSVTFGVGQGELPPLAVQGGFDPRVEGACAIEAVDAPATGCVASGSWTDLPAYDGEGFWNSGLVSDQGAVELRIADTIDAGSYAFRCLVHPDMTGTLRVVPDKTEIEPAELVHERALATAAAAAERADGRELTPPTPGPGIVAAGWTDGAVSVNRFAPARVRVRPGGPVTWRESETHDVTFDSLRAPDPGSGPLADGASYAVVFPRSGAFAYHCSMHVGMTGVVLVR